MKVSQTTKTQLVRLWLGAADRPDTDENTEIVGQLYWQRDLVVLRRSALAITLGGKVGIMVALIAISVAGNNRNFGTAFSLS